MTNALSMLGNAYLSDSDEENSSLVSPTSTEDHPTVDPSVKLERLRRAKDLKAYFMKKIETSASEEGEMKEIRGSSLHGKSIESESEGVATAEENDSQDHGRTEEDCSKRGKRSRSQSSGEIDSQKRDRSKSSDSDTIFIDKARLRCSINRSVRAIYGVDVSSTR